MTENKGPKLLKKCPGCSFDHPTEVTQCTQCGLFFDKWKDPQQRAAERRLSAMAEQQSKFSPSFIIVPLLLIGVPLLIVLVPDVGSHVLGLKLRYRAAPQELFSYNNSVTISIAGNTFTTRLKPELLAIETGAGNNNTYKKSYSVLNGEGFSNWSGSLERTDLSAWSTEMTVGPRGETIAMLGSAERSLRQSTRDIKQHGAMREEILRRNERKSEYSRRAPEQTAVVIPPTPQETAQSFFNSMTEGNLQIIADSFPFRFPEKRVRRGGKWEQNLSLDYASPFGSSQVSQKIIYTLTSFNRNEKGYFAVIEWETPVTARVIFEGKDHGQQPGQYKGKALIHYRKGFVDTLEGEYTVPFTASDGQPLLFKASHSIHRV